ncbi:MAG: zinc-binding dehydrogenase, partial [Sphingopyxis sp.]|nr:zinc-binding dehydrogenase [Sphingopyxis sp.]
CQQVELIAARIFPHGRKLPRDRLRAVSQLQQRRRADVRHAPTFEARHFEDVPGLQVSEPNIVLWAEHRGSCARRSAEFKRLRMWWVGLLLVQWLKSIGAEVIGTVSTEAKADAARTVGADHIIHYDHEVVAPRVRELTGGAGVRVVFDGIGMAMWDASLDSLGKRGMLVSYGNADAPVTGVSLGILAQKGSLFATRPTLFDYYADPADRSAGIARVWDMIGSGEVAVTIGQRYALRDAGQAHRDLEGRMTMGSTVFVV